MPYSGGNDPSLPANVKKLSAILRRKWVHIFNSVFKSCRSPKVGAAGSVSKCEGAAFKFANGAVKEMEMGEEESQKVKCTACESGDEGEGCIVCGGTSEVEIDEKCGEMVEIMSAPFGGATSFGGYDSFVEARDTEIHVKDMAWIFRSIVDNIFDTDPEVMSLSQKADAVLAASVELAARVKQPPEQRKSWLEKVKGILWPSIEKEPALKFGTTGVFMSFKDAAGRWSWMVVNTNKYEDREGEIFTEAAHKEYIALVDKSGEYPELWLWHTPGTRIGRAAMVDYVDGFVVHAGYYDEGLDDIAERLSKMGTKVGVSHGYEYLAGDEEDGVYDHYQTFELTLCPAARAANIWGTGFETFIKEVRMGFSPEKRKFFADILGEEQTVMLETKLPDLAEKIEEKGVAFKDILKDLHLTGSQTEEEKEPATEEVEGTPVVADAEPEIPSLEGRVGKLEEAMAGVGSKLDEIAISVKAAGESVGERIEREVKGALSSDGSPPKANGDRPSESDKTEVSEEVAEKVAIGFSDATPDAHPARKLAEDLIQRGPTNS